MVEKLLKSGIVILILMLISGIVLVELLSLMMSQSFLWSANLCINTLQMGYVGTLCFVYVLLCGFFSSLYLLLQIGLKRFIGIHLLCCLLLWVSSFCLSGLIFECLNPLNITTQAMLGFVWMQSLALGNPAAYCALILACLIHVPYWIYWVRILKTNPLGQSHFARIMDLKRSGLLNQNGLYLGNSFYGSLRHSGFEPVLCIAGTGGGKTTSLVVPNVLELTDDTLVITDIKGEIFELTATYRKTLGDVLVFEPESFESTPYNPFSLTRDHTFYEDIDLIFSVLIPESKEPIWSMGSRSIASTLVCMAKTQGFNPTLFDVYQALCRPNLREEIEAFYQNHTLDVQLKALCGKCLSVREDQFKDLCLQAQEYLSCFNQPNLAEATASNGFDFQTFRDKVVTIYIKIPANTATYGPICALFFEQLFQYSSQENNPDSTKKTITCFIDEFANLPKIPSITKGINYLRSYRVRICLFVQHTAQLSQAYGLNQKENFLAVPIKIIFNVSSKQDADYFSACCGSTTIQVKNTAEQGGRNSVQYQFQNIPLIRPDDLQRLPNKQCIILKTGFFPIKAKKNFWFLNRAYHRMMAVVK